MPFCIHRGCSREIHDDWDFCAFCGADNRPPERRHRVRDCEHDLVIEGPCCVRCGFDTDPQDGIPQQWRVAAGLGLCVATLAALAWCG